MLDPIVSAIIALKETPDAKVMMPFIFEESPLYPEFLRVLKICVGKM